MKPLINAFIIEVVDPIKERMTESGIYIAEGGHLDNFSEFEESFADTPFKKKFEKSDLTNKLIEASKRKRGLIDTIDSTENKRIYEEKVRRIIDHKKGNYGKIIICGEGCKYFKEGDFVFYRGQTEVFKYNKDDKEYVIVMEKHILSKKENEKYIPHPDFVLVKITKESRESLFTKKIKRDDGSEVSLFITVDEDKIQDRKSEIFVSAGEIVTVGENVKDVFPNDVALLHYLLDNNDDIIIGYDGPDKLIIVDAITTRHEEDNVVYSNRKSNRDQIVWNKGDYDNLSSLIGVVRNNELIPREPFVFLEHKETVVGKVTRSGILYYDKEVVLEREVLAISSESVNEYQVNKGMKVLVNDFDTFSVKIGDQKVSCVNDIDIMGIVN